MRPQDSHTPGDRQPRAAEYKSARAICAELQISPRTFYRRVKPLIGPSVPTLQIGRMKRFHMPSVIAALQVGGAK